MVETGPPAKSQELALFLAGDPATVAAVRKVIESVVSQRRYGIPSSERQDVVQHTLADLCRQIRKEEFRLRKGLACLAGFLAQCRCVDWFRRRHLTEPVPEGMPDTRDCPEDVVSRNEIEALATKIMRALPPACRWLMEMVIGQELTYAEVAAMTGRSQGALRVEMCTCLKKARVIHKALTDGGTADPRRGDRR
jgi:RNA polymerase sigma factor (sigma-70 family)